MKNLTDREKKRIVLWAVLIIIGLVVFFGVYRSHAQPPSVALLKGATRTATPVITPTSGPSVTPAPSATPGGSIAPYPNAPLCQDHDNSLFHTLWNSQAGCHYDHEHGQNPFTSQVASYFPGFDLESLLCGNQIGSCNPSSPIENVQKHGGHKISVQLTLPQPCVGFQGATTGANAAVVMFHAFGDQAIELEARTHSAEVLVRQCKTSNPTDYGYVFVAQLQDYGQRVIPYQGTVVAYPNQPVPAYDSRRGPYLTADCVNTTNTPVIQCRASRQFIINRHLQVNNNWTSGPENTGGHFGSEIFHLLFRVRDGYRVFDWNDQVHPFTWLWVCSGDGGVTYNPNGCRYNNSTQQAQEIYGKILPEWDNLAGFDSNPTVGRITAEGFLTAFGNLAPAGVCLQPGADCYPIKMVNAFVGSWGAVLVFTDGKGANVIPIEPSNNIFFCGQVVCAENAPGNVPSGWIGPKN